MSVLNRHLVKPSDFINVVWHTILLEMTARYARGQTFSSEILPVTTLELVGF